MHPVENAPCYLDATFRVVFTMRVFMNQEIKSSALQQ